MREIDVSGPTPSSRTTCLSYGAMRSGKTRWAASWPRPLFFSESTEGGWTTIRNMDANALWEPDRRPRVWAIEKIADMMQAIGDVEPLINAGEVQTIVIDSLTFYNDLLLDTLTNAQSSGGRMPDMRRVYGALGMNLRSLRVQIHNLPVNVVWVCLEKTPDGDNPIGAPMISGQQAMKFAAGTDYILYHRSYPLQDGSLQFEIRTKRWGAYPAGGRDEGALPDPLGFWSATEEDPDNEVFFSDCTYRTFADCLGITTPVVQSQPTGRPVGAARASAVSQQRGSAAASR